MNTRCIRYASRLGLALLALGLIALGSFRPAWAESAPTFTVLVDSAFLRSAPDLQAARTYSVFKGQVFAITGRTADSAWLQLDFAGGGKGTWIWALLGEWKRPEEPFGVGYAKPPFEEAGG